MIVLRDGMTYLHLGDRIWLDATTWAPYAEWMAGEVAVWRDAPRTWKGYGR